MKYKPGCQSRYTTHHYALQISNYPKLDKELLQEVNRTHFLKTVSLFFPVYAPSTSLQNPKIDFVTNALFRPCNSFFLKIDPKKAKSCYLKIVTSQMDSTFLHSIRVDFIKLGAQRKSQR